MQLQPFRRPNIIDAETTRDAIVRHLAEIRELYAQRNRTLFACYAAGNSDAHLRPSDFIATIAEPPKPKPGDLHDWDKLVDGCLYFDDECLDSAPYIIVHDNDFIFAGDARDAEEEWSDLMPDKGDRPHHAVRAKRGRVVAVGLGGLQAFKDAITNDIIARNEARGVK